MSTSINSRIPPVTLIDQSTSEAGAFPSLMITALIRSPPVISPITYYLREAAIPAIEQKFDHAKISCVPKMYLKKNQPCDQ